MGADRRPSRSGERGRLRTVLAAGSVVLLVAYPVLVYAGLARLSARWLGLLLLGLLLPPHLGRLLRRGREHLRAVLPLPVGIAALLVAAAISDDRRLVLALPVLINAVLLATFAASLRGPVTMVERFARMQVDDLSPAEVAYCRRVTLVWCGVFLVNGATIATLALAAPLSWWTAWTGGLAYALLGLVFAVEYVVRKARFRRFGDGPADALLARLLPTPQAGGAGPDRAAPPVARPGGP